MQGGSDGHAHRHAVTKEVGPRDGSITPRLNATAFLPERHLGALAGDYELVKIIGHGGGGAVYEARHVRDGTLRAIKVLGGTWSESSIAEGRFQREIEICRKIKHPGILQVLDAGRLSDGAPFYAMERLVGEDLERTLNRVVRLPPDECLRILDAIGSALEAAHAEGVTHRDLKASNVFLGTDGSVKLLDFGVARIDERQAPGLTARGHHVGTPTNMAPEQILCFPAEPRTDVYAAGVLLFRMLTGEYPFNGETREELMQAHLSAPIPRPSEVAPVPPAFDAVVHRCLQKRVEDRYESMSAFVAALRRVLPRDGGMAAVADAWGVYVHVFGEAADEDVLDAWVERLIGVGFRPALDTADGTLMVLPCGTDDARRRGRAVVSMLCAGGVWAGLRFVVHHDRAAFAGAQFRGGPMAEVPAWLHRVPRTPGVLLTAPAARMFD